VIEGRITLNGAAIEPAKSYRVTVNNYLALGGDGFATLRSGTAPQFGIYDSDALFAYVQANSPLKPAAQNRIARVD